MAGMAFGLREPKEPRIMAFSENAALWFRSISFIVLQQQYFLFKRQTGARNAGPVAPIASVLPSSSTNGSCETMSGARVDFMPTPECG